MNLTTYPLHVQSPVTGINHALTMVGVTGFEPATSSSRTKRATKLRHTPRNSHIVGRPSVNLKITCLDFGGCHTKSDLKPENPIWK